MQPTCNSCSLAFATPEDQRAHMKSDWHRYNLKRRVAALPPIDEVTFQLKVALMTENDEDNDSKGNSKLKKHVTKKNQRKREKEAILEQKRQLLETAKRAMLAKHNSELSSENPVATEKEDKDISDAQEALKQLEVKEALSEEQEQEKLIQEKLANKVDIPATTCLFCHTKQKSVFKSVQDSISHMVSKHGLYVPEKKFLVDAEGLFNYLGEKIGLGNVCLVCSYQGRNTEAVREHMLVKRHMRIPYESEDEKLEISEFYDFSSTYDDATEITDEQNEDADEDWEDVSGDEDDDEIPADNIFRDNMELILPSGAVIGHRSNARYFRQNLPPDRILSEGEGTVIAADTRHFLGMKDKHQVAVQKRAWNREKKREDINDRRSFKFINNQPHFRDPLLQ